MELFSYLLIDLKVFETILCKISNMGELCLKPLIPFHLPLEPLVLSVFNLQGLPDKPTVFVIRPSVFLAESRIKRLVTKIFGRTYNICRRERESAWKMRNKADQSILLHVLYEKCQSEYKVRRYTAVA